VKSRTLRIAFGVAISVFFLALAVRNIDWRETVNALQSANYLYIVPIMAATVWTLYIRAQRWRVFIEPIGVVPMPVLVAATNIGFMANMLLPLRIGEIVGPVLVSRRQKLPLGSLLATALLQRIFDMFTILLLFGISVATVPVSEDARKLGYTLTGLAAVVGGVIVLMRWQEQFAIGVVRNVCDLLPTRIGGPMHRFALGFVKALEVLDSPAAFLRAFGWSLYLWIAIAALNGLALVAFRLPVRASVVVTAIVAVAVSVPSAPGFLGSFQYGCKLALEIFSVAPSDAFAYSIVLHVTQFVGIVAAGVYSLWSENMTLRDVEAIQPSDDAVA